jgi:hypothetical protein
MPFERLESVMDAMSYPMGGSKYKKNVRAIMYILYSADYISPEQNMTVSRISEISGLESRKVRRILGKLEARDLAVRRPYLEGGKAILKFRAGDTWQSLAQSTKIQDDIKGFLKETYPDIYNERGRELYE